MARSSVGFQVFTRVAWCVLAVSFAGAAMAAVQDANLPPKIVDYLAQARQDCPAGFQARGAVEEADLTGQGRPAYIVNPHRMVCAGSPHLFGGDGPASIELFVTLPSGELVHTGGVLALGYRIDPSPQGGAPIIAFQTHDTGERAGSVDRYRWDGRNFALLERHSMAVPPVDGPDKDFQQ
jgi:hypothetical protein